MKRWDEMGPWEQMELFYYAQKTIEVYMEIKEIVDEIGELYNSNIRAGYCGGGAYIKKMTGLWTLYDAFAGHKFNFTHEKGVFTEQDAEWLKLTDQFGDFFYSDYVQCYVIRRIDWIDGGDIGWQKKKIMESDLYKETMEWWNGR